MFVTRRLLLAAPPALALAGGAARAALRERDLPIGPTPEPLVEAMLDLAQVGAADRLIDLGSGDGRIALAAARRGATALGIEIDSGLVARARSRARDQGLGDRASFLSEDLFTTPLRTATVVTLYLLTEVNLRLRPRLLAEMTAGSRLVSHAFDMGDWSYDATILVDGRRAFLWIVPAVAGGEWLMVERGTARQLSIVQRYQKVSGSLDGRPLAVATLRGDALAFPVDGRRYAGKVGDAAIEGDGWRAERG